VKKQTLFHYDDIGIFTPELKKDNQYRYYSYTQLELFHVISILKELEMPLKDIKTYLDARSPDGLIHLLEKQVGIVDSKLEDLIWLRDFLNTKIKLTRDAIAVEAGIVHVEELVNDEFLISTPYNDSDDDKKIVQAVTEHLNFCHSQNIYSAYSIGGMIPSTQVPTREYYNYSHFYTKLNKDQYPASNCTKPRGKYAVIYHMGGFDNIYNSYEELEKYLESHQYSRGDYFYEDVILDELAMKGPENYVLKISIQITGAN
jgi:effector-binding domain-containing protein